MIFRTSSRLVGSRIEAAMALRSAIRRCLSSLMTCHDVIFSRMSLLMGVECL